MKYKGFFVLKFLIGLLLIVIALAYLGGKVDSDSENNEPVLKLTLLCGARG